MGGKFLAAALLCGFARALLSPPRAGMRVRQRCVVTARTNVEELKQNAPKEQNALRSQDVQKQDVQKQDAQKRQKPKRLWLQGRTRDGRSGGGGGPVSSGSSGSEDGEGDDGEEKNQVEAIVAAMKEVYEKSASGTSSVNPYAIFSIIVATFIATWVKIDNATAGLRKDITDLRSDFRVFAAVVATAVLTRGFV
mmetsp:Transcript_26965/g.82763  ORF Transcript_26965/g.82763 Transcript_26965/m.82763 type:complete len:194 (-) Transcript_26965:113-694(-)